MLQWEYCYLARGLNEAWSVTYCDAESLEADVDRMDDFHEAMRMLGEAYWELVNVVDGTGLPPLEGPVCFFKRPKVYETAAEEDAEAAPAQGPA